MGKSGESPALSRNGNWSLGQKSEYLPSFSS